MVSIFNFTSPLCCEIGVVCVKPFLSNDSYFILIMCWENRWLISCCFSSQISRLEQTWMLLRQRHTEGAILYEKTLKPFMKSLNDGKGNNKNNVINNNNNNDKTLCYFWPPFGADRLVFLPS